MKTRAQFKGMNGFLILLAFLCVTINHVRAAAPGWLLPAPGGSSKSLAENTPSGNSVVTLIGSDLDSDPLTYSIKSQTPSTPAFLLSGDELQSPGSLNAEAVQTFTFVFTANDGTSSTDSDTLTVTITDVNEFTPVFSPASYTASIQDGDPDGTAVVTVTATDDDVTASITYSITAGNGDSTFGIAPASGAITIATSANVDSSTTSSYSLTVQASDGTNVATTTVTVSVTADLCSPSPCQNSGTCSQSGNSYTCTCASGFTGTNCDTADLCTPSPCQNSGTCVQTGNSYTCTCAAGFTGTNCDIDSSSATTTTQGTSQNTADNTGLSDGAIAGVVIGGLVGVALVSAGVYFIVKELIL